LLTTIGKSLLFKAKLCQSWEDVRKQKACFQVPSKFLDNLRRLLEEKVKVSMLLSTRNLHSCDINGELSRCLASN